jgi:hypothetical protein
VLATSAGDNFVGLMSNWAATGGIPNGTILGLPHKVEILLALPAVMIAIYLLHVFAWQMGLLYRLHHDQFNWVLQKADKSVRNDTLAQLHRHRQREMEAKARRARENLEQRLAQLK